MYTWILLTVIGAIFSLTGLFVKKHPPKKINNIYGYRTSSSMKNQARWDFAQTYSSRLMVRAGLFMFFGSFILGAIQVSNMLSTLVSVFVMLFSIGIMFYHVEKALRKME